MISIKESFPTKSKNYLLGQDVIWTQFNEVNFYVEDIDQENLYFHILKKIFSNINFKKIFPLGGKTAVEKKARQNLEDKKKIFILDNDFDDILKVKVNLANVFYLKKYSIENYMIDRDGIYELIKEEDTKIKDEQIDDIFNINHFWQDCHDILRSLASNFLVIRKFKLGIEYLKFDPQRDCDFGKNPKCLRDTAVQTYYAKIGIALERKYPRFRYSVKSKWANSYFDSTEKALINIPGKYMINLLKCRLKKLFNFSQTNIDTFTYRLAKNCTFEELNYLKLEILSFMT